MLPAESWPVVKLAATVSAAVFTANAAGARRGSSGSTTRRRNRWRVRREFLWASPPIRWLRPDLAARRRSRTDRIMMWVPERNVRCVLTTAPKGRGQETLAQQAVDPPGG